MKIYADVEQGSEAWRQLRLGRPTASNFNRIVTKKKCELSAQAVDYALKLCAEKLLNMAAVESFDALPWLERGKELEPMAVKQYEMVHEVKTLAVGFITTDDGLLGCSPDRLVVSNQRHAIEVKCPSQHVHLGYLLNGTDDDYKPQVQGQILVAELERADLYSYHPQMPPALITTTRDDPYQDKLSAALTAFNEQLAFLYEKALKLGVYQPATRVSTPAEIREITDIQKEHRRAAEKQFIKEGFNA